MLDLIERCDMMDLCERPPLSLDFCLPISVALCLLSFDAFLSLDAAVNNVNAHDSDESSVTVTLLRDIFDDMADSVSSARSVLHALSDSVHILGQELSELERHT